MVNRITGRSNSEVSISSLLDPQVINMYFQSITTDSNYTDPVPLIIPEGTRLPKISIYSVVHLLLKQKPTAAGPDDLPYWFWRDYAYDLAPVITKIFNTSLQNGVIPDLWKLANLLLIPKVSPFTEYSQLRPISLTNIIMRLFERTIYINELSHVIEDEIHKDQFTYRKNHSSIIIHGNTTHPLPEPLPTITRKSWLKILGVNLHEKPGNWDNHFNEIISKAGSSMYILRVCKYYGFSKKDLDLLFHSLIVSALVFGIEVWGCASYSKYLIQIDKLFPRAFKYGYSIQKLHIVDIINTKDKKLWDKILANPSHALHTLYLLNVNYN